MKNTLSVIFAVALMFSLSLCLVFTACGKDDNGSGSSKNELSSGSVLAEGTFDEGVTLSANKTEKTDENYTATINKIADKNYDTEKVAVFDISLVKEGVKVQPDGKVKITMPVPFETEYGYAVYHVKGEIAEELIATLKDGKISFETESFSYFIVVGKIDENAPTYTLVDKNGKEDANGGYVLFGSYPQTAVKDDAVKSALAQKAGALPEDGNNGKWTSYDYPYGKNPYGNTEMCYDTDFMWYIDVEHDGSAYRGVYFTHYRPNMALNALQDDSDDYISSNQKPSGYLIGNSYWFKYEPVLWQIIRSEEGKAQLLCMTAIDSQPYTLVTKQSADRIKDELDTHYVYYNGMPNVPAKTLGTNYEYSAIRRWLNEDFYGSAFNAKQKKLINETLLDNATGDVGADTYDKVFVPSIAELAEVKNLDRKASDYAKSQGIGTSYPGVYCFSWYTRDTYYILRFSDIKDWLTYDSDRYDDVCSVRNGSLYQTGNRPVGSGVTAMSNGVVPSLWITL